jgi:hypothetical protein
VRPRANTFRRLVGAVCFAATNCHVTACGGVKEKVRLYVLYGPAAVTSFTGHSIPKVSRQLFTPQTVAPPKLGVARCGWQQTCPSSAMASWKPNLSFSRFISFFLTTKTTVLQDYQECSRDERCMHRWMVHECFFACVGTMTGLTSSQPKHAFIWSVHPIQERNRCHVLLSQQKTEGGDPRATQPKRKLDPYPNSGSIPEVYL